MSDAPAPAAWRLRWYHRGWPVLAVALGVLSAWWMVGRAELSTLPGSPWQVSLLAGSPDADPYTRARVAMNGLLALSPQETLYYVARADSSGRPLRAACRYRVAGSAPEARWWSVTAYAEDLYLFPDPGHRYSVDATAMPGPTFTFDTGPAFAPVAPDPQRHWLPTPGRGGLILTLRLYQPAAALVRDPLALSAPRIERIGECP